MVQRTVLRGVVLGGIISVIFFSAMLLTLTLIDANYSTFTTNLPVVVIKFSQDEPPFTDPVIAQMQIFQPGEDGVQTVNAPYFDAEQGSLNIQIHARGKSTLGLPKKQFAVKTLDNALNETKVSLLGLPADSKWVWYGPYQDHSLVRNILAFTLFRQMGHYAPRMEFVEMVFAYPKNKYSYRGIYLLEEKITRGKNRVDVEKQDNTTATIDGGYIIKFDHTESVEPDDVLLTTNYNTTVFVTYPKKELLSSVKLDYLNNYLSEFESSLLHDDHATKSYDSYINVTTFVDTLLINELSKNYDAYRLSSYFYKPRNGVLCSGPLWDQELGFGNHAAYSNIDGWMFTIPDFGGHHHNIPFWWPRLVNDSSFYELVQSRWSLLRSYAQPLSTANILTLIGGWEEYLSQYGAASRDDEKWQTIIGKLKIKVHLPHSGFETNLLTLKQWFGQRLAWMDQNIAQINNNLN